VTSFVVARELSRWYGQVVGLTDLSVTLEAGMVGLLGPNGAGKSTLLRLVSGEIRPSRGRIEVLGREPFANRAHLQELGFCPQQDALYGDLSGREFVTLLLRLHGFPRAEARSRAGAALERVDLSEAADRPTRGYSRGMRQRVRLAQAIAHSPRLLVADEPLAGLDPLARRRIGDLLRELARDGTFVLVSSHVLHEVEELTRDVLLLHRGRLLAQGSVPEIRALLDQHPRRIEIRAREPRRLARELLDLPGTRSVQFAPDGEGLSVETTDIEAFHSTLPAAVSSARAGVRSLRSLDSGLDAVFDYLVK